MMYGVPIVHCFILTLLFFYFVVSLVALVLAFWLVNNVSDGIDSYLDNNSMGYMWNVKRRKEDIKNAMGFFDTLNAAFTPIFNVYVLYCLLVNRDKMRQMILSDMIVNLENERRQERNKKKLQEYEKEDSAVAVAPPSSLT